MGVESEGMQLALVGITMFEYSVEGIIDQV